MALDTRVDFKVASTFTNARDLSSTVDKLELAYLKSLTNGTGSGQSDLIFHDQRTINASATDSLDLAGSLTNAVGATLTFAKLKLLYVRAASTNTNNVNVTRPASNGVPLFLAAGDGVPVLPDGALLWVAPGAGVTVTAGTGDLIDLVNSGAGTSVVYEIVLIGTSA